MRTLLILLSSIALAACSSGGGEPDEPAGEVDAGVVPPDALSVGVETDRFLDELTTAERHRLCDWMVAVQGGPHTVDCGDGVSVTIDPVESCVELDWPHCEVALLVDCVAAQAEDLCAEAPPACAAFYDCVYGG